ncbi:MAG: hypothetical protein QGG71_02565 [Pirellulaceae bacterium]|jgi:hypothetical protein|nr:hypothetical protein [Pirellulaceae bacterium]
MTAIIDFSQSFLTFRIDTLKKPPTTASHKPPFTLNNARIQIECRCRVTDKQTGNTQTFVMGANCKTERVGVERDIWTEPNADFVPVFSDDGFMHIKTYASAGVAVDLYPHGSGPQSDRQTGQISDAFDDVRIDVVQRQGVALNTAEEIVAATLANQSLVACSTIHSARCTAVIEYPIKTINANERDMIYQTDTGPVLLPDLDGPAESMLSRLEMAFAAFNSPDWIEFLVRVSTTIASGANVYHYATPVRLDCQNQIFRNV